MKRGTPRHPKLFDLCERLKRSRREAIGILELLWHFTAEFAPQGDIGRFTDARIEAACDWNGRRGSLVEALRESSWIDEHKQYRLLVHDWHEHAEGSVKKRLERAGLDFLTKQQDTAKVTRHCPSSVQTMSATLPDNGCLPKPSPMPMPVPIETPDISDLVSYLQTQHPPNRTCHEEQPIAEALARYFDGAINPGAITRDIRRNHQAYLQSDDCKRGVVMGLLRWIKERALVKEAEPPSEYRNVTHEMTVR